MTTYDYPFLKACRREPVEYTPVWIMRQAGRYMKEYNDIRSKISFLELCKTPELAAKVTILPIDKLGVDAAILFSDILVPIEAMGMNLEFGDKGPVLDPPVCSCSDIDKLIVPDPEQKVPFVMNTIRILRKELEGRVPLIGFSGAPFTLASYILEGGTSKNYIKFKTMMYQEPKAVHALLDKIAKTVILYLNAQIQAGAQAVQIFDSWAGALCPRDYEEFAKPYTQKVVEGIKHNGVPIIHYANDASTLLGQIKSIGVDVISIDWRIDIDSARAQLGDDVAIQGNLDPCALFLPPEKIEERVCDILQLAGNTPGHIFNLGHGILPPTPVENAVAMVEAVHKYSKR